MGFPKLSPCLGFRFQSMTSSFSFKIQVHQEGHKMRCDCHTNCFENVCLLDCGERR